MLSLTKKEKIIIASMACAVILGAAVHIIKVRSSGFAPEPVQKLIEESKKNRPVININKAGENDLLCLEGIGPAMANTIVTYREKNGPFLTKEDIKKVKGIGPKKYEAMKDRISTRDVK